MIGERRYKFGTMDTDDIWDLKERTCQMRLIVEGGDPTQETKKDRQQE